MKWVRCVYNGVYNGDYSDITVGKVYDVLSFNNSPSPRVVISNDLGIRVFYLLKDTFNKVWFEDATAEVRDNKINEILD